MKTQVKKVRDPKIVAAVCRKGKDGSIDNRLSDGKQLDRLAKKRSGYCVDRGSFYSDSVYICRNGSETLLERSSSGNLSVAYIIVEVRSDRKRRWSCADGDWMDPGNTAGMCDFSDSDPSGSSGWGLHAGIGNGKKKGTSFCTVFIGRISGAVYLRTGKG